MSALQELRSSRRPKRGDDVCFGAHVVSDRDPIDALRHVGRVEGLVGGVELQSRHQAGGAAWDGLHAVHWLAAAEKD